MKGKTESFLYLITKIVIGVIGIFSVGIQTKYIEPGDLGAYALISGLMNILIAVFISWIGSSGLRYFNSYQKANNYREFYSTLMLDWGVLILFVLAAVSISGYFFDYISIRKYLPFVVMALFFGSLWDIFEKILRASSFSKTYCVVLMIQSLLSLGIIFYYNKYVGDGIRSLFLAKILSGAVAVIIGVKVLCIWKHVGLKSFSAEFNAKVFSYGIPMVGVWGIGWLLNYSDRYIIKFFLNDADVGLYDVAYRFTENSMGMVIAAFNLAFFPAMIKTWNEGNENDVKLMIKTIFRYYFLFSIPIFVGILLLKNKIYGTILDVQYASAAIVMSITGIGFIFMGINNTFYKIWQLKENTKMVLYLTIVSVFFNLSTNIIFIPRYGYLAAATTTTASYIIITIIAAILINREIKIAINMKSLLKQVTAAVVMGVFILLTRSYISNLLLLAACAVVSAGIYFCVLFLLGDLAEDINEIKKKLHPAQK